MAFNRRAARAGKKVSSNKESQRKPKPKLKKEKSLEEKRRATVRRQSFDARYALNPANHTSDELAQMQARAKLGLIYIQKETPHTLESLANHLGRCVGDLTRVKNGKLKAGQKAANTVIGFTLFLLETDQLDHPFVPYLDVAGEHKDWLPRERGTRIDPSEVNYHCQHEVALIWALQCAPPERVARMLEMGMALAMTGGGGYQPRMVVNAFLSFYTIFTSLNHRGIGKARLQNIYESFVDPLLAKAYESKKQEDEGASLPMALSLAGNIQVLIGVSSGKQSDVAVGIKNIEEALKRSYDDPEFGVDHARNTWDTLEVLCKKENTMRAELANVIETATLKQENVDAFIQGRNRCVTENGSTTPAADDYIEHHHPELWKRLTFILLIAGVVMLQWRVNSWTHVQTGAISPISVKLVKDGRGMHVEGGSVDGVRLTDTQREARFGGDGRAMGKG